MGGSLSMTHIRSGPCQERLHGWPRQETSNLSSDTDANQCACCAGAGCRRSISTLGLMTATADHYRALFAQLEAELGALGNETATGIVGFSAGGPVAVRRVPGKDAFVTCELSLYPEQVASSEGENFE